ncbi:hypothetical protein L6452_29711 [Arctium lappa]|uniref:Uncharacterized protein n=1 Tax=Arctium lappa TaxID=4217 RepID=A0ACB8ZLI7_ARCLA|nr:hypothetical protein L6452_29711 [Arctium lappa]
MGSRSEESSSNQSKASTRLGLNNSPASIPLYKLASAFPFCIDFIASAMDESLRIHNPTATHYLHLPMSVNVCVEASKNGCGNNLIVHGISQGTKPRSNVITTWVKSVRICKFG